MLQIQINCKQFSWGGPLDLPLPEPTLLTCLEPFCTYTSAQRLESDSALLFCGGEGICFVPRVVAARRLAQLGSVKAGWPRRACL